MALKLLYFGGPGGGEVTRLILTVGGVAFEDVRIDQQEWKDNWKAKTPYGQVPVLYVDDKPLAQSKAIEMYCARRAGLESKDEFVNAKSWEIVFCVQDAAQAFFAKAFSLQGEEKTKAIQALLAEGGAVHEWFKKLEKIAANHHKSEFLVDDHIRVCDLALFSIIGTFNSGQFEGVEVHWVDKRFPQLVRHRNHVAKVAAIKGFYEKNNDGPRKYFLPHTQ